MKILNKIKKLISIATTVGFIHLLSANFLIQVAGFGGQIFLTRVLSVENIGTIKIYQSYLNILVIIASLGLNTAVLKLCSEDISSKERINLFNISFIITVISSTIIIISTLTFYYDNLFKIYIFLVPILSITNLIIVYLQAQQKIKTISYIQSVSKVFIIICSTVFACLFGINGYIKSLVILTFITFLFICPFIKKEIKLLKITNIKTFRFKRIYNISIFAFGANLLGVLLINLNIIIANLFAISKKEIGYFSIAQLIISTMMILPTTLGQIMVPKLSRLSNDANLIMKSLKPYNRSNILLALSLALLALISGPFLIPLFFGLDYKNSVLYFETLLIGFVFWSYYSPKGITLLSVGRSDLNFYVSLITLGLNIVLNIILIKHFAMEGAAVANIITNLLTIFINNYFFNKEFKKRDFLWMQ